jgi:hypothetical protein
VLTNLDYLGLECHDVGENGYLLYGFVEKPRDVGMPGE